MLRTIKEFFSPSLKCQRIGHDCIEKSIKIRKKGGGYRVVVTDYNAKIKFCKRCHCELGEPYDLEYYDSFTGCEMPARMWGEIREKGYLNLDQSTA